MLFTILMLLDGENKAYLMLLVSRSQSAEFVKLNVIFPLLIQVQCSKLASKLIVQFPWLNAIFKNPVVIDKINIIV